MLIDKSRSSDAIGSTVTQGGGVGAAIKGGGVFAVKCFDAEGNLKWEASTEFPKNFFLQTRTGTHIHIIISHSNHSCHSRFQSKAAQQNTAYQDDHGSFLNNTKGLFFSLTHIPVTYHSGLS